MPGNTGNTGNNDDNSQISCDLLKVVLDLLRKLETQNLLFARMEN